MQSRHRLSGALASTTKLHRHYTVAPSAAKQWDDLPTLDLLISACCQCAQKDLDFKALYAPICRQGLDAHPAVGNLIIRLLIASGNFIEAQRIFNKLQSCGPVPWSDLISGCLSYGNLQHAVWLYLQIQEDGCSQLLALLKACASLKEVGTGRELHAYIICTGLEHDLYVGSSLVDFYVKCSSMSEARNVFDNMNNKNVVCWNALLAGYVESGAEDNILCYFHEMQHETVAPDAITFTTLLKACQHMRDVDMGREVHKNIVLNGIEGNIFIGSSLVTVYAKCGFLSDAWETFRRVRTRDAVLWTALIVGCTDHGEDEEALKHVESMMQDDVAPTPHLFCCILKSYSNTIMAEKGRQIHMEITEKGFEGDVYVGTSLVDMYAKCLLLLEAFHVLTSLPVRTVASWNALITGYVDHGQGQKALECYKKLNLGLVAPDATTFACSLKACVSIGAIKDGQDLHNEVVSRGLEDDILISTALVDLYSNAGHLSEAQKIFDTMRVRNVVVWNALVAGYAEYGQSQKAVESLEEMRLQGISPSATTFTCILECCSSLGCLEKSQEVHSFAVMQGYDTDYFVSNVLVNLYAKLGALAEAKQVFNMLQDKSLESWTSLIMGYIEQDENSAAISCFEQMRLQDAFLDAVVFVCVLKACGASKAAQKTLEVHQEILSRGMEQDPFVGITLVDVYCKCNFLGEAHAVFLYLPNKNAVAWNALIGGYAEYGPSDMALALFDDMQLQGISPSIVTYISVLKACSEMGAIEEGTKIHNELRQKGLEGDPFIVSSLIDMYGACGCLPEAWRAFNRLSCADSLPSWNAMLKACSINNAGDMAIHLFEEMQQIGVKPDTITFTCLLTACSRSNLVIQGEHFLHAMQEYGIRPTVEHLACMVDILARSGHLYQAEKIFECLPHIPSKQMWTVLLGACNAYAEVELAERCFQHLMLLDDKTSCKSAQYNVKDTVKTEGMGFFAQYKSSKNYSV